MPLPAHLIGWCILKPELTGSFFFSSKCPVPAAGEVVERARFPPTKRIASSVPCTPPVNQFCKTGPLVPVRTRREWMELPPQSRKVLGSAGS